MLRCALSSRVTKILNESIPAHLIAKVSSQLNQDNESCLTITFTAELCPHLTITESVSITHASQQLYGWESQVYELYEEIAARRLIIAINQWLIDKNKAALNKSKKAASAISEFHEFGNHNRPKQD